MAEIKLFNRWDTKEIVVKDPGLQKYIGLKPVLVPHSAGRYAKQQFHKSNLNIVERLMKHLFVPGHRGKRHHITSGSAGGKGTTAWKLVKQTFSFIESRTKKNPIEVFVRALENAALHEEITSFQIGGIMVRKAVITAPQRRVDSALRLIVQSAYQKSTNNPKRMSEALADEIIAAHNNDAQASVAIKEKERIEREAAGAR